MNGMKHFMITLITLLILTAGIGFYPATESTLDQELLGDLTAKDKAVEEVFVANEVQDASAPTASGGGSASAVSATASAEEPEIQTETGIAELKTGTDTRAPLQKNKAWKWFLLGGILALALSGILRRHFNEGKTNNY